jgi:hypothetical protein
MRLSKNSLAARMLHLFAVSLFIPLVLSAAENAAKSAASVSKPTRVLSFSIDRDASGKSEGILSGDRIKFDFGAVSLVSSTIAKHSFILKNENKTPLTIRLIAPNCDCVSVATEGSKTLPVTVAPGEKISIDSSVDLTRLYPGLFNKLIYVFVKEQTAPAATIELTGSIKAGVAYSSDVAEFGTVMYGDQPSQEIAARVDKRVVADLDLLKAKSTNPDITIEKVSSTNLAGDTVELKYAAKVSSNPQIGPLSGSISLFYVDSSGASVTLGSSVKILGEVVGSISVSPKSLEFDGHGTDYPPAKQIIVTGLRASDIAQTKLDLSSAYLHATLLPPPSTSHVNACKLSIEVDHSIAVGNFQDRVTLTAPDGERIIIPVSIQITGAMTKSV